MNRAADLGAERCEMIQIQAVVFVRVKAGSAVIASLNDVERNSGEQDAGTAGHRDDQLRFNGTPSILPNERFRHCMPE